MKFVDIIFFLGIILLTIGIYSVFSLLRISITKSKEELKDLNIANLWILFLICLPLGLVFVYFWFYCSSHSNTINSETRYRTRYIRDKS